MSHGIKKNPSQTLVHDGFFSSYSVFGYFSVKTGRLFKVALFFEVSRQKDTFYSNIFYRYSNCKIFFSLFYENI